MNLANVWRVSAFVAICAALAGCQNTASSSYGGSLAPTRSVASASGIDSPAARAEQEARRLEARRLQREKRNAQRRRAGLAPLPALPGAATAYAPARKAATPTIQARTKAQKARLERKTARQTSRSDRLLTKAQAKRRDLKAISKKSKKTKVAKAPRIRGKGKAAYRALVAKHARAHGVPVELAMAVVQVESNFKPSARGAAGEIGLMQIMPRTARGIGYKGKMKALYNPDTNIRYGMKYLGEAYRRGGKTTCGTILKYNAGHYAKKSNPISRRYCKRVKSIMRTGKG